jgi:hypothetical protein
MKIKPLSYLLVVQKTGALYQEQARLTYKNPTMFNSSQNLHELGVSLLQEKTLSSLLNTGKSELFAGTF